MGPKLLLLVIGSFILLVLRYMALMIQPGRKKSSFSYYRITTENELISLLWVSVEFL